MIFINPGAGETDGDRASADAAMQTFVADLAIDGHLLWRFVGVSPCGRFSYELTTDAGRVTVDMPGLAMEQLRDYKNCWHATRLYVDGSSWLWPYAIRQAREGLQ